MISWFKRWTTAVAAVALAIVPVSVSGQTAPTGSGSAPPRTQRGEAANQDDCSPRCVREPLLTGDANALAVSVNTATSSALASQNGQPDLQGIWQVLNSAEWDLQGHAAQKGVPASVGVVEGNDIPYQPWAAAKKKENFDNRLTADPLLKCYRPGVPRITYLPFPFQVFQFPDMVAIVYEYLRYTRFIYTDGKSPHPDPNVIDFWMGHSLGRWEGDTLVVDTTNFNGQTWFDRAGNFHSDALHVVERFARRSPDVMSYEVTIDDPKVFTRPWKVTMPLYRRQEHGVQLLEYECYPDTYDERDKADEAAKAK